MGLSEHPTEQDVAAADAVSHDGILRTLIAVSILGCVVGAVFVSIRSGLGFLLGGMIAFANYYWLKASLAKFFDKETLVQQPGLITLRFLARYAFLGICLAVVYLTGVLPVIPVILGAAGFAFAVMIEGILGIFKPVENNRNL